MSDTPTKPGTYWARDISYDLMLKKMVSLPYRVEVIGGVPNERGHELLVKTGSEQPRYRALKCYEWGCPTPEELEMISHFASQFQFSK